MISGKSRPTNGRPDSQDALFERTAETLLRRLGSGPNPLELRDGLQIRALVRVDLYPPSGRFQIIVSDIDPEFTLGKLALDREQILRELRSKGLDRLQTALPLPRPPLRIGVLTSPDSDGWNDFIRHIEESKLRFQVTLYAALI